MDPTRARPRDDREHLHRGQRTRDDRAGRAQRRSASGSRSTTSGPATRRSATCAGCPSTSSRSTRASSPTSATRRRGGAIVAAVTNLAHVLGLTVTAEGVETESQRDEVQHDRVRVRAGLLLRPADARGGDQRTARRRRSTAAPSSPFATAVAAATGPATSRGVTCCSGPAVAVRVAEVDERTPGEVLDLADRDAPRRRAPRGRLDVGDDHLHPLHRSGRASSMPMPVPIAIEHAEPGGVSCTKRRSALHGLVVVGVEPDLDRRSPWRGPRR